MFIALEIITNVFNKDFFRCEIRGSLAPGASLIV